MSHVQRFGTALALVWVAVPPPLDAASLWSWESPLPQGNVLFDIQIVSPGHVVAVGGAGTLIETTNGGLDWAVETLVGGVSGTFEAIDIVAGSPRAAGSARRGTSKRMAVRGGCVTHWTEQPDQITYHGSFALPTQFLHAIETPISIDPDVWIAAGDSGHVFKTLDCGESWIDISLPGAASVFGIHAETRDRVIAATDEGIFRTDDCGLFWDQITASYPLAALDFADAFTGMAVGDFGTALGTDDGGETWFELPPPTANPLSSVTAIDADLWIAVGFFGEVFRTTDGGFTWTEVHTSSSLLNAADAMGSAVYVAGYDGEMLRSADSGLTFSTLRSGPSATFYDVDHLDEQVAVAVGHAGRIANTTDGGMSWEERSSGTGVILRGVAFEPFGLDCTRAYAVGRSGVALRSMDHGDTWTALSTGTFDDLNALLSREPATAVVVGEAGLALRTTDAGENWTPVASGTDQDLDDIAGAGPGVLVATGRNGAMVRSTDEGLTWAALASLTSERLEGVAFADDFAGIAVGGAGTTLRTTDGGLTWASLPAVTTKSLTSVTFLDASIGVAVGPTFGAATTLLTSDGGASWVEEDPGTALGLSAVSAAWASGSLAAAGPGAGRFTAVGGGGSILRRGAGEVTDVGTGAGTPLLVELAQNHPNPFNPVTTIRFRLGAAAPVDLRVFDVAGREVARLAQGPHGPGAYRVRFDGSGLPSAVYLYRLRAGAQVQSRKLTLLQ